LVKKGLLGRDEYYNYFFTSEGYKTAMFLQNKVKEDKLRTNPRENEKKIFEFLQFKEKSYRNEIARELKINPLTVRDVLRRLIKKNKVKFTEKDKFQRRFYSLKKNGCGITHSP
jgi:predicted HTH transcriptional regulator